MKRTIILTLLAPLLMVLPAFVLVEPAFACGGSPAAQQVSSGIDQTDLSPDNSCGETGVKTAIKTAVDILSTIVGIAAIVAIINSGFKYITSGGDSGKVGNAKNTLIYAIIGLIIVALAQLIVRFVLTQAEVANNADNPCKTNASISATDPACKT